MPARSAPRPRTLVYDLNITATEPARSAPTEPGLPADAGFRPQGLARLLLRSFQGEDMRAYAQQLIALAGRSEDTQVLVELSLALLLSFQREAALAVLRQAVRTRQVYPLQRCGIAGAPRLLVIKTVGDLMANTPLECILQAQAVDMDVVYVTSGLELPADLPAHDLVFVAVAEAEAHLAILGKLASRLRDHDRPVLNRPEMIPSLSRDRASARLRDVQGLYMPPVTVMSREQVDGAQASATVTWPWIIRPHGSHAGQGLARLEHATGLPAYLEAHPADHYYVAPYVDYASDDGLFRKYRIVMVDGQAYPCHMGISRHWMVHYPYPEMKADAARRDQEAAFMGEFRQTFGRRHEPALRALQQRLGLDYLGFDCAETRDGRLLIFEVSNALVIHDMDLTELFPYKSATMQRAFAAFAEMIRRHAHPAAV